jgi:hypothetical protein
MDNFISKIKEANISQRYIESSFYLFSDIISSPTTILKLMQTKERYHPATEGYLVI